ncbi:hypothetical protein ATI02_0700 [Pseudomonas baetica]|uniref:Uncharacterized protein n=1 Tax=Pseudomonas baetica TaxID=674054 RepID=A0ABX4PSG9_9PSED|nr:hypothetical protein ATI02_0700 [Pseudomonas baetica]
MCSAQEMLLTLRRQGETLNATELFGTLIENSKYTRRNSRSNSQLDKSKIAISCNRLANTPSCGKVYVPCALPLGTRCGVRRCRRLIIGPVPIKLYDQLMAAIFVNDGNVYAVGHLSNPLPLINVLEF